MKKNFVRAICMVLAICSLFCVFASATTSHDCGPFSLAVRVNGDLVSFPDAKPFVDENNRTMIPVRFVTESLGAKVSWDQNTKTASIAKNGITVKIKIGNKNLSVVQNGKTKTVTMDTEAIVKNDRTYVPIRFVAESLGAFVDYSTTYKTVSIFQDVLTASQIKALQSVPLTQQHDLNMYESCKEEYTEAEMNAEFGIARSNFSEFATAREDLYHSSWYIDNNSRLDTFISTARKYVSQFNDSAAKMELLADESCIYQPTDEYDTFVTVRGIVKITDTASDNGIGFGYWNNKFCKLAIALGFSDFANGKTMYIPVDIYMTGTKDTQIGVYGSYITGGGSMALGQQQSTIEACLASSNLIN